MISPFVLVIQEALIQQPKSRNSFKIFSGANKTSRLPAICGIGILGKRKACFLFAQREAGFSFCVWFIIQFHFQFVRNQTCILFCIWSSELTRKIFFALSYHYLLNGKHNIVALPIVIIDIQRMDFRFLKNIGNTQTQVVFPGI